MKITLIIIFGAVLISQEIIILSEYNNESKTQPRTIVKTVQAVKMIEKECEHEIFTTKDNRIELNETDMQILYRVASAEAGTKNSKSIKNVVTVILNRISNPNFEEDIDVETTVFRFRQFSCIQDGGYARAIVTDLVIKSVKEAVISYEYGKDTVKGATHYANLSLCDPEWQYTLKKLNIKDPVGHTFFK